MAESTEQTPLSSSGRQATGSPRSRGSDTFRPPLESLLLLALGFVAGAVVMFTVIKLYPPPRTSVPNPASRLIPPLDPTKSCPNHSPVYPSEGGPDCPEKCTADTRSVSSIYHFVGRNADLDEMVSKATDIISSLDTEPDGATTTIFRDDELHITFGYYCCQTDAELDIIATVLEQFDWDSHAVNVSFEYVTCAIDGPSDDHVSLILMLDERSNRNMMKMIENIEHMIEKEAAKNGMTEPVINVKRRRQEPFHATLALVSGSSYPIADAVKEINSVLRKAEVVEMSLALTRPCDGHDEMFC